MNKARDEFCICLRHQADGMTLQAAVAPTWGANVLELTMQRADWLQPQSILERVDIATIAANPSSYGIPILAPTPGRMGRNQDGRFSYRGAKFLAQPSRHGFLRNREWRVTHHSEAELICALSVSRAGGAEGQFPYAFEATYALRLDGAGLHARLDIESTSAEPQPVSAGFHPYFQCDRSATPRVRIPASHQWELWKEDDEPTPTGLVLPVRESNNFGSGRRLPATEHWDDVFTGLSPDGEGRATAWIDEDTAVPLRDGGSQTLRLRRYLRIPSESRDENVVAMKHLQLYTPPWRDAVALEPLASPPNALNMEPNEWFGGLELFPGGKMSFEYCVGMDVNETMTEEPVMTNQQGQVPVDTTSTSLTEVKAGKPQNTGTPSTDAQPHVLFTNQGTTGRHRYPITYVQFGVLGDLCFSRINREIFEYSINEQENPFQNVWLCDTVAIDKWQDFLADLYLRSVRYERANDYFQRDFCDKVNAVSGEELLSADHVTDVLREGNYDDPGNYNEWHKEFCLTKLGHFLRRNYRTTATRDQLRALFSNHPIDNDWLFYLSVAPQQYENLCTWIADYFSDAKKHRTMVEEQLDLNLKPPGAGDAVTRKIVLLEKPFQRSAAQAQDLHDKLRRLETDARIPLPPEDSLDTKPRHIDPIRFYSVDHYAAKWTLSEIPDLVKNHQPFRRIVEEAKEIVIELLERQPIPAFRLDYFATTGLFMDMMPHALIPLQLLYGGKEVTLELVPEDLLAKGIYDESVNEDASSGDTEESDASHPTSYERELEDWKQRGIGDDSKRFETYFSLKLRLRVTKKTKGSDKSGHSGDAESPHDVTVYIRSGKNMFEERKRVIIKRPRSKKRDASHILIDIARESIEIHEGCTVSVPKHITPEGRKAQVKGYAKILLHIMNALREEKGIDYSILELLKPENACRIIGDIEHIGEKMGLGAKDPRELTPYRAGRKNVIVPEREAAFEFPWY